MRETRVKRNLRFWSYVYKSNLTCKEALPVIHEIGKELMMGRKLTSGEQAFLFLSTLSYVYRAGAVPLRKRESGIRNWREALPR